MRFSAAAAPILILIASSYAQAANFNCPTCEMMAARQGLSASSPNLTLSQQLAQSLNVASIVNHPRELITATSPATNHLASGASTQAVAPNAGPAVSQDFVGSFQVPWVPATVNSNFDPSFHTPYWSEAGGLVNDPSAPWNLFVPAAVGSQFFQLASQMLNSAPLGPRVQFVQQQVTAPAPPLQQI